MSQSARRPEKNSKASPAEAKGETLEKPAAKLFEKPKKANVAKAGVFADLFGGSKDAQHAVTQSKATPDTMRVQKTLSSPAQKMPDVTSPSQLKSQEPKRAAAKPKRVPQSQSESETRRNQTLARGVLILVLFGLAWMATQGSPFASTDPTPTSAPLQALSPQELAETQKRVEFHREEIGHRLNRERIKVEYENAVEAPPLRTNQKVLGPDMMAGAPLVEEPHHRTTTRDRTEMENPDYADARIAYALKEQQAANEDEAVARKQYVDEFVANAAKAGLKVRVDKNGVVTVEGQSQPMGQLKPNGEMGALPKDVSREPSSSGSIH